MRRCRSEKKYGLFSGLAYFVHSKPALVRYGLSYHSGKKKSNNTLSEDGQGEKDRNQP